MNFMFTLKNINFFNKLRNYQSIRFSARSLRLLAYLETHNTKNYTFSPSKPLLQTVFALINIWAVNSSCTQIRV